MAAPKEQPKAIPYLGPGSEKLTPADYERIYKRYIQSSILLGYTFFQEKAPPCEQAVQTIFRQAGFFQYPVPAEAQQVVKTFKTIKNEKIENYQMGGLLIQIVRSGKSDSLSRMVIVNSSSTKASRMLGNLAKTEVLTLEKDPVTRLERVKGVPVGFPHSLLTPESQGLYVKILKFEGEKEKCQPISFFDNSWVGGYDITDERCNELQTDTEQVFHEKISPEDFALRETKRLKDRAYNSAIANGMKPEEAKALVDKNFVLPFTNEISVVGGAMRNLAQCNLMSIGHNPKIRTGEEPEGVKGTPPAKGESSGGGAH